ncbi:metallophosphoesterase [Geovibrio thiophilus]|uniref:Phosphoesterase n=1 Tax=Geovibrio thiophilus TaxID=139438 RepID=A0A3R5UXD3_9BACT|nr:metallophosphoesterase family protein [Geovibrio thiophilus]QAR32132.1 metallophosphoesterase [Geovibrio thiophilus]
MRVLIISDTHSDSIEKLPASVLAEAKAADAVLHAGDIIGLTLISELRGINPSTYAVRGNMDSMVTEELLPSKRMLQFDGVAIGLIHGEGSPFGLENRLLYEFDGADIIVYGHTHKPFWGKIGDVYFLNPGSPTANRYQPQGTYALLFIEHGRFRAEIKQI